jgi:hypothetical protein
VVAVGDNETVMRVGARDLVPRGDTHGEAWRGLENVVRARSYAEAAGILLAHRHGILLEAITPVVSPMPITRL